MPKHTLSIRRYITVWRLSLLYLLLSVSTSLATSCDIDDQVYESEHFVLTTRVDQYVPADWSVDMLDVLEEAYDYNLGRRFPDLPPDNRGTDDRLDVAVGGGLGSLAKFEIQYSDSIARDKLVAAHEIHHVFQEAVFGDSPVLLERWLSESAAQWMGIATWLPSINDVPTDEASVGYLKVVPDYLSKPEDGLLRDSGNFDPDHPGYSRWILWHYVDSFDTGALLAIYETLAAGYEGGFTGLEHALLTVTGAGFADHLLPMAAAAIRFQELAGFDLVDRRLDVDDEVKVLSVECLGYAAARVDQPSAQVRASVVGSGPVGVIIVQLGSVGALMTYQAKGDGEAELTANLDPQLATFVIGANLTVAQVPCDEATDLTIRVDSTD